MVWPCGTANSGNGLSTSCSFRLQRSAISIVRLNTAGESLNTRAISSALFTKNWSLSNLKRSVS